MAPKDSATEQLIKEMAKKEFFAKGNIRATTQDIADCAGVNRALIHYYFRSRDQLFEMVLKDGIAEVQDRMVKAADAKLPIKERIMNIVHVMLEETLHYPYLEIFMITQINLNPDAKCLLDQNIMGEEIMKKLAGDLIEAMERGEIPKMSPVHFIANMTSLTIYPLLAKPILQNVFKWGEAQYLEFIKQREDNIRLALFGS
jgi:TetR/AcrR family transcriptional regulator